MDLVAIVSAHHERAVVRAGGVYLKVETDTVRAANELEALGAAPVPVPAVRWSDPGPPALLATASVDGTPLARLGEDSPHPREAWVDAGRVARRIHDATPPAGLAYRWDAASVLDTVEGTRRWLLDHGPVDTAIVEARAAFVRDALADRVSDRRFVHGDLQAEHLVIADGRVAGVVDWSDAGLGDPLHDLAVLTVGHGEFLDAVLAGYGADVDRRAIRAYWTARRLGAVRWRIEHGYAVTGDVAVLNHDPDRGD